MTLDEQVLAEAKEARQRLVDLESQTAHVRVDYHHAIKKLHAAGGSLREIADALELSHQRVHQIVDGPAGARTAPGRRRRKRWPPRHRRRQPAVLHRPLRRRARSEVMVEAQKEADSLKHPYLGTEHLMLALVEARRRGRRLRGGARAGRRAGRRGRSAVDRRVAPALHAAGEARPRGGPHRRASTQGASSSARTTSSSRWSRTRAAWVGRSSAISASQPSSCASGSADSGRGRVAAAVHLDEQGGGAGRRLGEHDARLGVAAHRPLRRPRRLHGEFRGVGGELRHPQRQLDRSGTRLVGVRGQIVAIGDGVCRRERRQLGRERLGPRGQVVPAGDARRQQREAGGQLERPDDCGPGGERLRRGQRCGRSRRCRR